jgi:glycerol-3-phosphate acyltransferase PlsY
MHVLYFALLIIGSYLVGAIPNGLIVGLIAGKNPLQVGSGKLGTANTVRAAGPAAGALVLVLDLAKGALAALAPRLISWPDDAWLGLSVGFAAAAAIVGHNWSLWVRLYSGKWGGGRGIITALGAMLTVNLWIVLAALLAGGLALLATRFMAIGAIVGAMAALVAIALLGTYGGLSPWFVPGTSAWCLLVLLGFHDSVERLLKGTESKLGSE